MERIAPKPALVREGAIIDANIAPVHLSRRLTRVEDLFVVAQLSVPDLDKNHWSFEICGLVDRRVTISFEQLLNYPKRTIEASIQCAGNPFDPTKPARQIANVKWGGVDVRDLLNSVGVDPTASHLWAYGLDYGEFGGTQTFHYRKDIPLARIEKGDVLIAYELNGAPLSSEHGFPARLVVPGFYGTNSVKWLCRLELADSRPEGIFTTEFYNDPVPGGGTKPVWAIEPDSIFVSPAPGAKMRSQASEVWGWAWSSSPIRLVEVSFDGGRTWRAAHLESRQGHSWQKFSAHWSPSEAGEHELQCRATDDESRTQPVTGARNSIYTVNVFVES